MFSMKIEGYRRGLSANIYSDNNVRKSQRYEQTWSSAEKKRTLEVFIRGLNKE